MKLRLISLPLALLSLSAGLSGREAPVHPHLFFSQADVPAIRQRAEATDWLRAARASLIQEADRWLSTPTNPYPLLSNGVGIAGRALQQRVGLLAFAGYLTGEQRYFDKGVEILLAVTRQTEPADRNHWRGHLQYSDAAQAFAIGYDWLAPFLTPAEREEVAAEIRAFGELLFTDQTTWGKSDPGVSSCNHNAVQFGALGLCAMVLDERPDWLARATGRVRDYFRYFADGTGYVTEGHDYQAYGMMGAMPFATALLRKGGPDLASEQPVFPLITDQILWKLLPFEGRMLAMNDNDEIPAAASVTYTMLRYRQPVHLWAWWESVRRTGQGVGTLREGLCAPFLFLWGDAPLEPVAPADKTLALGHRFESGRVFLRSSWTDPDAAHVSFTSGYDFHRGHNHQDENAVTLYALGEGFLIDPGYQPAGSRSHNTLRSIDGAIQVPNSSGRLLAYREIEHGAFIRGQAPEAYQWPKEGLVESGLVGHFDRKVLFVRGPQPYLAWHDDAQVENDNPQTEFVAQFVTYPKNRVEMAENGFTLIGQRAGARCRVWVMSPVANVAVVEEDLDGKKFSTRGRTYAYSTFYRGITATVRALNPRLFTLAFPYRDEAELPRVKLIAKAESQLVCELAFRDGRVDRLIFDDTTAQIIRTDE